MYLRTLDSALTAGCPRITILSWLCRGRHGCARIRRCREQGTAQEKTAAYWPTATGIVFLPFVLLYALRRRVRIRTVGNHRRISPNIEEEEDCWAKL
jgi:hypothetical protein